MPLFFEHYTDEHTKLAVWHITEPEAFFAEKVTVQQEITHPHKRLQHLAGRYILKFLFPEFPSHLIAIAPTRKPYIPDDSYHFSISHCGNYAAAIVSKNKQVGIDIEVPTPKVKRIEHKFLHPLEYEDIYTLPVITDADNMPLTIVWSAKEAIFKWYGRGEVDFKNHIWVDTRGLSQKSGMIPARFNKQMTIELSLNYRIFTNLCLVWVIT